MQQDTRFELIDESHGEGSFGKVQRFRDNILERTVAVKVLKLIDDEEAKERFAREAKILARLSHPSVPAIYDVIFKSGEMQILCEFIEGNSLRKHITDKYIPTIEQAQIWFTQIASALEHAHELGIIHRDIKPDNIIISPDKGTATLVDFGIAYNYEDQRKLTACGYVIGTPAYMSPEQKEGQPLDGRTDIYSLGVTLYETLAGYLPNPGQYIDLSETNESIPPSVDDLIKLCIVHDKNNRLAGPREFKANFKETIRTDIPLSNLLTDARLHEILSVLGQLSADEFHAKPMGQRLLILNRLKDLVRTDRHELKQPTLSLISQLLRLAILESPEHYTPVVQTGFNWGFDKEFTENWKGDESLRDDLINASKKANSPSHKVISVQFLGLIKDKNMEDLPGWYYHDLRKIVIALLANTACGEEANELAKYYDLINQHSH